MPQELDYIVEECLPNITGVEKKLSDALFYLFYRIKELEMEDSLIHMDQDLSALWKKNWEQYDKNLEEHKLIERLGGILNKEFTPKELESISALENFSIKTDK